jgi:hypothetical protein
MRSLEVTMAIKMKKSDLIIAFAILALVITGLMGGLFSCQEMEGYGSFEEEDARTTIPDTTFNPGGIIGGAEDTRPKFTESVALAEKLTGGTLGTITIPRVGQIIAVDISKSNLAESDAYYYAWYRDGTSANNAIPGAKSQEYTLTADDMGHTFRVAVSAKG